MGKRILAWSLLLLMPHLLKVWIVPQPRQNVWVISACALQHDHLCLSMASADDRVSTCLGGMPFSIDQFPSELRALMNNINQNPPLVCRRCVHITNPLVLWRKWSSNLPELDKKPTEFELLGSLIAPFCVQFIFKPSYYPESYISVKIHKKEFQAANWCKSIRHLNIPSSKNQIPLKLPKGMFLICGQRAWAGGPLI